MKKTFIVVWLLIIYITAYAQQGMSDQQQYLNAKALFGSGKYKLAMEAFKPLISENEDHPFSAYAAYYYAVAAYQEGYSAVAKNMFLQVREWHPTWSNLDEVNYWLGVIYFEQHQYNQGLHALNTITSRSFFQDIANLKYHYFTREDDIIILSQLYESHSNDSIIAEVLVHKLAAQPLVDQDKSFMEALITKFNIDRSKVSGAPIKKSVFKEQYNVAVMFPFMINDLEADNNKKVNQFVLDMYLGMRQAIDTLRQEGINIKLYAYDTKRDTTATKEILSREEMKGMDLIIGPLFSEPAKLVSEFSYMNQINMINPISTNMDVVGLNPFSFLLHPSNETVGKKAAEYASKHARNNIGIVFYGESKNDSAMAFAYKQRIEQDSIRIIEFRKIRKDNTREVLDLLLVSDRKITEASSSEDKEGYAIALDSIGHVFVASDNDLISSKVISALETRGDSILVVGSANWLELPAINFDSYQRLGAVLYAPQYTKKEILPYLLFRNAYTRKHKTPPTKYAEKGYELMQVAGRNLYQYGKYFQIGWEKQGFMEGYLTIGYSYPGCNDNQVVPMLSFAEGELKIIYEIDDTAHDNGNQ